MSRMYRFSEKQIGSETKTKKITEFSFNISMTNRNRQMRLNKRNDTFQAHGVIIKIYQKARTYHS